MDIMKENGIQFQFLAEPSDVNFGGKVHGGAVMKWIDQTAFACASNWSATYCVTIYVGGIRFYKPIQIGDVVKIDAKLICTGKSSMHISVDVKSKSVTKGEFVKTTHCVIVFVAVNEDGKPVQVTPWVPTSQKEIEMEAYAIKLKDLRKEIESEMTPHLFE